MKRALLALLAAALLLGGWLLVHRLFQDDERRVREIFEEMRLAAEAKNTDGIMKHFSSDYQPGDGPNLFILRNLVSRFLAPLTEVKIQIRDLNVLVTGDTALVTLKVVSEALDRGGQTVTPFGSDQAPETPRLTMKKTTGGDWKIVKVEDVNRHGFGE